VLFFGLFLLFLGLFSLTPLWKKHNIAIFLYIFAIFQSFFRCPLPPGNFSADALGNHTIFLHIYMRTKRSTAASEHRNRNPAVTTTMRFRYTNFVGHSHLKFFFNRTQHSRETKTILYTWYVHKKKGSRTWASISQPCNHDSVAWRYTIFTFKCKSTTTPSGKYTVLQTSKYSLCRKPSHNDVYLTAAQFSGYRAQVRDGKISDTVRLLVWKCIAVSFLSKDT